MISGSLAMDLLISILSTNLVFFKHFSKIFLDWPQLHRSAHRAPCYGQSLIKICLGHVAPVNLELCRVSIQLFSTGSPTRMCRLGAHQKQELLPCQLAQDLKVIRSSLTFTHLEYFHLSAQNSITPS